MSSADPGSLRAAGAAVRLTLEGNPPLPVTSQRSCTLRVDDPAKPVYLRGTLRERSPDPRRERSLAVLKESFLNVRVQRRANAWVMFSNSPPRMFRSGSLYKFSLRSLSVRVRRWRNVFLNALFRKTGWV